MFRLYPTTACFFVLVCIISGVRFSSLEPIYEALTLHKYIRIDVTYNPQPSTTMKSGAFFWPENTVGKWRRGMIRSCRPGSGVWVTRGGGLIAGCSTDDNVFLPVQLSSPPLSPCQSPFNPPPLSAFQVRTLNIPLACCDPLIQHKLAAFSGPLTQTVKRTLTISNNNVQPVAFKVKTTAPKVCLHPRVFGVQLEGAYRTCVCPLAVLRKTEFWSCGAWSERRGPG